MDRSCLVFLEKWLLSDFRKPLILRGARQVGKTWLARRLAQTQGRILFEVNIEDRKSLASLFERNDPKTILQGLSAKLGMEADPKKIILFIDEIQAAPELIAKLRWFAEKMPELPVLAAGSLLEFTLANYSMSMPVGRIDFMYVEPFSFEEFLHAIGKTSLVEYIKNFTWKSSIPLVIHEDLMQHVKEYIIIGGMPAAIDRWIRTSSLQEVSQVHASLIRTYRDDFPKYSRQMESEIFQKVLDTIPKSLGKKFVYRKVDSEAQIYTIKRALNLLCKALIAHKVEATAANGIPLSAETNERYNKIILIDVALCSAALGLSLDQIQTVDEITMINKGGIAEQLVGQLLRNNFPLYQEPLLYYWLRTEPGLDAEVDFVIQHRGTVIPIEVKSGTTGTLKSLHEFMRLKKLTKAVRINSYQPEIVEVNNKDSQGMTYAYQLRSIPFYLTQELPRLLEE